MQDRNPKVTENVEIWTMPRHLSGNSIAFTDSDVAEP